MGLYAFHPELVIAFEDCKTFLELLDWCAAISNFRKGQMADSKFEFLFQELIRSSPVASHVKLTTYQAPPATATEKALTTYLETDENALKLRKQMKEEYGTRLAAHKISIKNR